jgi:hypothetical protein
VLKYLDEKDVNYYVVTKQRHHNLRIIERFIVTLFDWMKKNKPISTPKINQLFKHTIELCTKQPGITVTDSGQ